MDLGEIHMGHGYIVDINLWNSYPTAYLFIAGGGFLGGLLVALYKGSQRYW